jgi:glutamyl-tRNA synthetase
VIDDLDTGISHVIRGDDHLNNTPKQLNLFAALGQEPPQYAHVPMILGADGGRLSKRHGAVNVLDYREAGYLPEALLNYLVRLGWSYGDQEIFSIDEMVELFDIVDVNQSASTFNPEKLEWVNQQHIIHASTDRLVETLRPQLERLEIDYTRGPSLPDVVNAYRERSRTLVEMAEACRYCFEDFKDFDPVSVKKHLRPVVLEPLRDLLRRLKQLSEWNEAELSSVLTECAIANQIKLGKIGQPVRVAITGNSVSPPIDVTLALVGRDRSIERIERAIVVIEKRAAAQ